MGAGGKPGKQQRRKSLSSKRGRRASIGVLPSRSKAVADAPGASLLSTSLGAMETTNRTDHGMGMRGKVHEASEEEGSEEGGDSLYNDGEVSFAGGDDSASDGSHQKRTKRTKRQELEDDVDEDRTVPLEPHITGLFGAFGAALDTSEELSSSRADDSDAGMGMGMGAGVGGDDEGHTVQLEPCITALLGGGGEGLDDGEDATEEVEDSDASAAVPMDDGEDHTVPLEPHITALFGGQGGDADMLADEDETDPMHEQAGANSSMDDADDAGVAGATGGGDDHTVPLEPRITALLGNVGISSPDVVSSRRGQAARSREAAAVAGYPSPAMSLRSEDGDVSEFTDDSEEEEGLGAQSVRRDGRGSAAAGRGQGGRHTRQGGVAASPGKDGVASSFGDISSPSGTSGSESAGEGGAGAGGDAVGAVKASGLNALSQSQTSVTTDVTASSINRSSVNGSNGAGSTSPTSFMSGGDASDASAARMAANSQSYSPAGSAIGAASSGGSDAEGAGEEAKQLVSSLPSSSPSSSSSAVRYGGEKGERGAEVEGGKVAGGMMAHKKKRKMEKSTKADGSDADGGGDSNGGAGSDDSTAGGATKRKKKAGED